MNVFENIVCEYGDQHYQSIAVTASSNYRIVLIHNTNNFLLVSLFQLSASNYFIFLHQTRASSSGVPELKYTSFLKRYCFYRFPIENYIPTDGIS